VFIGVEADEHRVLVHLDLLFMFLLQVIEAPLQLVLEDIAMATSLTPPLVLRA